MSVALARLLAVAAMGAVPTAEAIAAVPPCAAGIDVRFDRDGGAADGMSRSGVVLVLRNTGAADCFIPGLPTLQFADAAGHGLAVRREPPLGMHPGPVVTPLVLAPGAEATAALTWVGGDVFNGHHCMTPARVVIGEGPNAPTALWRFGQLCGEPGKPIPFRQPVLRRGPVPPP